MKMFKKYIYIGLVLAGGLSSCNDDFLEKLPETSIGRENFFNTEEDLKLAIYNLYDFPSTGIYTSDAYNLTDNAWSTGNVELKTIMTTEASSNTISSGWTWNNLRNINFFLENFEKAKLSEARLNHYEGLARFFRARFYVDKIKRYSDVPWIEEVVTTQNDLVLYGERDSREFVVSKILEDYEFAVEWVDANTPKGSVDKWVILADYTRFLLYEGTYRKYHAELNLQNTANSFLEKAVLYATQIMESGKFSVYSTGKPESDYLSLFSSQDLSSNPEIIMARFYEFELLNGDGGEGVFGNYETSPLKDLVQAYLMEDGSYYSQQANYENFEFVKEFEGRDPRLSQTFAFPGWVLKRSGTYAQGAGLYVQQLQKNFSGYHQIKGFYNTQDQKERNNMDVPLYRYAEVLLNYAEAKAELGQLTQQDLDKSINLLRRRVGMVDMKMNPSVDPFQAEKHPNVQGSQRAEILEIRRERRIELALEGYRFDDIMRWANGKNFEKKPAGIYFSTLGKHDLTGDGIDDIYLLPASESIPVNKESNSLGVPLQYYRVGTFGQDVNVFLENGDSGTMQLIQNPGNFVAPKHYYRPIPRNQVSLNPNLKQIFDWN